MPRPARQQPAPTQAPDHFEVWYDVAGQRRHRRAAAEADVPALVNEIVAECDEETVGGIEVLKVTIVKETVPTSTGGQ